MEEESGYYEDGLQFYAGSRLLAPFSRMTGWNIDKINFLACQVVALVFAYYFRTWLHPAKTSPISRHTAQLLIGFCMTYFCYGYQTWSVVLQTIVCLILMKSLQPGLMEKAVFVVSLGWLCIAHIYRQYYDYGGYTLDITGPLMMNTQRMSSIAFSLIDGQSKDVKQLSPSLQRQAIRKFPSLLEVFSYMFCFTTASCGPFIFYNDYLQFIEGKNIQREEKLKALVIQKFLTGAIAGIMLLTCAPMFPVLHLTESTFFERGFFSKMFYIIMCTSFVRTKYYFAWKMAEAANHNAGLGFRGYSKQGEEEWDLVDNLKIRHVELSTSLKVLLDNWNISTTLWLRHVVYVRMPYMNTLSVFFVSALWHGFYPGYYFTFFTASLFITASRLVRRNVRPYFQSSADMTRLYDGITFLLTRISLAYLTFPFVLLEFMPAFTVYTHVYWWLHILSVATIVFFTFIFPSKKKRSKEDKTLMNTTAMANGLIGEKKGS